MLQLLRQGPLSAGKLSDQFNVSRPTMSARFAVLKEADLVHAEKTARFGGRMPKTFVPDSLARQARRVAASSLVRSGFVYAGLWAFTPIPIAVAGGSGAVLLGMAVTMG